MRAAPEKGRDDLGFTVTELLVTMVIMSIVAVMAFAFIDGVTATTTRSSRQSEVTDDMRVVLRTMTQELRAANPILGTYPSGSPSCPAAGSYPASMARCIVFEVRHTTSAGSTCPKTVFVYGLRDDKTLREDRTDYDASCGVARSYTGKVLLRNVLNTTTLMTTTASGCPSPCTPLFTFYDANGVQLDAAAVVDQYVFARTAKVNVVAQYQRGAPPVVVSSSVSLRNNR